MLNRGLGNLSGTLMREDIEILRFEFRNGRLISYEVLTKDKSKLPFIMSYAGINEDTIVGFFEDRTTPETRHNLYRDLNEVGIAEYFIEALVRVSNGRACSDSFYMKFD